MKAIWAFPAALAAALAFPAAAASIPAVQHEHGIAYVSGGIGHDEAMAMRHAASRYPLSLVFSAGKDNEYLSGVKVRLAKVSGKVVLDQVSDGPIMLVKVPPGRYEVKATRDGRTERRTVSVPAHGDHMVAFHWRNA